MTQISVIVGSTRQKRFSEKPARWIFELLKQRAGVAAEFLDLRDFPMPYYDEPISPGRKSAPFANEVVERWTAKIAAADGFIIVTPEYNHGYPAVLKNAMDYVYKEWNRKAVGFVTYGGAMGARGVEQLRLVSIELQMAPVRSAIHLPPELYDNLRKAEPGEIPDLMKGSEGFAANFLDQLIWWTKALEAARATK